MPVLNNNLIIILLIIFALYIIIYIISKIECKLCKINTFYVKNDKNSDKLKLVFISDFHNKKFKNNNDDLILKIKNLKPDYVILGGDFVDFSTFQSKINNVKYIHTFDFINKLAKELNNNSNSENYNFKGIFFGFGNHELRLKKRADSDYLINIYNELINILNINNIKILENNTYKLTNNITLSGLNLFEGYYNNFFEKKNMHEHISNDLLEKSFSNINTSNFNIMLFHKPDYCEDFINYGFDLVLSGHNHGGLINFPFIGPLFSPDLKLFPKYNCGKYNYKDKTIIVSSGIGEHFIKIRVNNLPEICVININ